MESVKAVFLVYFFFSCILMICHSIFTQYLHLICFQMILV